MSQFLDLPYQREGVQWLASQARAGLADEQGLGKSVQAIMAADKVNARRVAVVCPAKLTHMWRRSFEEFGDPTLNRKLRVMSYEEAVKVFSAATITRTTVDAVILDEAHYLKNPETKRVTSIYPMLEHVPYVWPMTGTPTPNGDPSECYPHLRWLRPDLIMSERTGNPLPFQAFQKAFCELQQGGFGKPRVVGVKNPELLKSLNRQLWLRRTLAEVQPQLPPMRYGEILLKADRDDEIAELDRVTARMAKHKFDHLLIDASTLPVGDEELSTLRRLLAVAKARVLAQYLEEELETYRDQKVVVFAWHTEALARLAFELDQFNPVLVDGSTRDPAAQVEAFQKDPLRRVFLGQIRAAGTGFTLTAASNVIFLELSWTPADNAQAERRILRIGQTAASCLCRHVVLKDSIDEAVTRVLARKSQMNEDLF